MRLRTNERDVDAESRFSSDGKTPIRLLAVLPSGPALALSENDRGTGPVLLKRTQVLLEKTT